jgi:hypothetical protein
VRGLTSIVGEGSERGRGSRDVSASSLVPEFVAMTETRQVEWPLQYIIPLRAFYLALSQAAFQLDGLDRLRNAI